MTYDDAFAMPPRPEGGLPDAAARATGGRPRYRPPIGIPNALPETPTWRGVLAAVLLHALVIALIVIPFAAPELLPDMLNQGAGGPGPAGGGGGGRGGTGGEQIEERVNYIRPTPPPAAAPDPTRLTPPVEEKKPEEVPPATPPPVSVDVKTDVTLPDVSTSVSAVRGTGGGTGNDGSNGSGPGTGGGVGSGVGTGRGSSVGPGTGGGPGGIYPPVPQNVVLPPMGLAQKYCPYEPKAFFDVDERGGATLIAVQPPARDRGYQKQMLAILKDYRFRPATRTDGTPVRDTAMVEFTIC
jgi:protein TonB